jgi:hypothetical protein
MGELQPSDANLASTQSRPTASPCCCCCCCCCRTTAPCPRTSAAPPASPSPSTGHPTAPAAAASASHLTAVSQSIPRLTSARARLLGPIPKVVRSRTNSASFRHSGSRKRLLQTRGAATTLRACLSVLQRCMAVRLTPWALVHVKR